MKAIDLMIRGCIMTHEQHIKPKTAKLAKEAGFDWETYTMYIGESDESKIHRYEYKPFNWNKPRKDFEKDGSDNLFSAFINQNKEDTFYSAPTQSVLQRWLREVKGIYLHIAFDKAENGWYTYIPDTDEYSKTYSTFEEALEVALQECLTLIIENNEIQINR